MSAVSPSSCFLAELKLGMISIHQSKVDRMNLLLYFSYPGNAKPYLSFRGQFTILISFFLCYFRKTFSFRRFFYISFFYFLLIYLFIYCLFIYLFIIYSFYLFIYLSIYFTFYLFIWFFSPAQQCIRERLCKGKITE